MFCTHCGTPYRDHAHYCIQCGEPLDEISGEDRSFHKKWLRTIPFLKKVDFLQAFYDLSFHQFITPKITGILLGLSITGAFLVALLVILAGFQRSTTIGILSLIIGGPLIFLLISFYARVLLETILKIFQRADLLSNTKENHKEMIEKEDDQEFREDIQWNI